MIGTRRLLTTFLFPTLSIDFVMSHFLLTSPDQNECVISYFVYAILINLKRRVRHISFIPLIIAMLLGRSHSICVIGRSFHTKLTFTFCILFPSLFMLYALDAGDLSHATSLIKDLSSASQNL